MMQPLLRAGLRLAEALRAENEALAQHDLTRAAALALTKQQASDAFAAAYAAAQRLQAKVAPGEEEATAEALTLRLRDLGEENRRLLERAIALQSRVIETIAGAALPRTGQPVYGAAGRAPMPPPAHPPALALSARA
jgi:hypothetical protein